MRQLITFVSISILILLNFSCDTINPPPEPEPEPTTPKIGDTLWVFSTDEDPGNWQDDLYPYGHPAMASDGTIYFVTGQEYQNWTPGKVWAVNPDGTLKWKSPDLDSYGSTSPPAVGPDGTIYVTGWFTIYAINPNTGGFKWTYKLTGEYQHGIGWMAIGNNGEVFFAHTEGGSYYRRYFAVNSSGQLMWAAGGENTGISNASDLVIGSNGILFMERFTYNSNGVGSSYLVAADPGSGEDIWATDLGSNSDVTVRSITIAKDGNLIVVNQSSSKLIKMNSSNGSIIWTADLSGTGNHPVIRPDGSIIIDVQWSGLECYGANGQKLWVSNEIIGTGDAESIDAEGKIICSDSDNSHTVSYILDASGNLKYTLGFSKKGAALIGNNGIIYAFDGAPVKLIALQGDKPLAATWARPNCGNKNTNNINLH